MTLQLDQITQKKLVLVKQLYVTASAQASARYSVVSRIMAVIGFDLAVETILKVIVSALDTNDQPERTFEAILQQANIKLLNMDYSPIPDAVHIRHVHSIRNDAQHKVKYPTENDVVNCREHVREFLQTLMSQLWGLSFDEISLVDLIQSPKTKRFMLNAEAALHQKHYKETVRQANTGLVWATSRVRRKLFGGNVDLRAEFDFTKYHGEIDEDIAEAVDVAFQPVREEISGEFNDMRDALLCIAFGVNYAGYVRLSLMAEYVAFEDGTPVYQREFFRKTFSEDDAQFALQFCTDAIIQIEAQVGNIDEL